MHKESRYKSTDSQEESRAEAKLHRGRCNRNLKFCKNDDTFGLPIIILLSTGIRSGELRALSPGKFDFKRCCVLIDSAVKRDGTIGPPKNGKERIVPINKNVMTFIEEKSTELRNMLSLITLSQNQACEADICGSSIVLISNLRLTESIL